MNKTVEIDEKAKGKSVGILFLHAIVDVASICAIIWVISALIFTFFYSGPDCCVLSTVPQEPKSITANFLPPIKEQKYFVTVNNVYTEKGKESIYNIRFDQIDYNYTIPNDFTLSVPESIYKKYIDGCNTITTDVYPASLEWDTRCVLTFNAIKYHKAYKIYRYSFLHEPFTQENVVPDIQTLIKDNH